MIITMSDYNLESLEKRCEEKELQGYEYVTPIKDLNDTIRNFKKSGGKYDYAGANFNKKYKVAMKKVN